MKEALDYISLHIKEEELASRIEVSAFGTKMTRPALGVPTNVRGLTIVDLAAGASSLTAELLEEGADAYALDQVYNDRSKLLDGIEGWLARSLKIVESRSPMRKLLVEHESRKDIAKFLSSFDQQGDRYIQGWLSQLPFPDDFADQTISFSGISVLNDLDILRRVIMEAIRITKPGGVVVIAPFLSKMGTAETVRMVASRHNIIIDELQHQDIGRVRVESSPSISPDKRLEITKSIK